MKKHCAVWYYCVHHIDQRQEKEELSDKIRKKQFPCAVKGCKSIIVPVPTSTYVVKNFKEHGTITDLPHTERT